MDIEEILALDRDLTDEEMEFLEACLLKTTRQLAEEVRGITASARDSAPELIGQLERAVARLQRSVEAAVALGPGGPHQA